MKQFFQCCVAVLCFVYTSLAQPATCKDSSFRKTYSAGGDTVKGIHQFTLSDNHTLIAGRYKPAGAVISEGLMILVNDGGNMVKTTRTASPDVALSFAWTQGVALKNNTSILVGVLYNDFIVSGRELVLSKRDADLNTVWTRRYAFNPAVFGNLDAVFLMNEYIVEADNGDLLLTASSMISGSTVATLSMHLVARINAATGAMVWCKSFIPVHAESWGYAFGTFQSGNSVVVTGYLDMPPVTDGDVPAIYAMKLNMADGTLQQLKRYRFNNQDIGSWGNTFDQYKARKVPGGYEIYGEMYEDFVSERGYMTVQLDENLVVTGSQSWKIDEEWADWQKSVMDTAGNFVVLNRGSAGNTQTHLGIYSRSGKSRRRQLATPHMNPDWEDDIGRRIAFKPNGKTTLLMNYYNNGTPVTELMQLIPEDTLPGCTGSEVAVTHKEISFKLMDDPTGWKQVLNNGLLETVVNLTEQAQPVTEGAVCKTLTTIGASALLPAADTGLCKNDSMLLAATAGMNGYTWPVDYRLLPVNETTVKVFPDRDTAYIVQATTARGCLLTDTIRVNVLDTPRLFLPADTSFCAGSSVVLQSHKTFDAYQWSTGETSAFITINREGVYKLHVTDQHGCRGEETTVAVVKDCISNVYIPTGFTPDNDGINDVFKPVVYGSVASYYFAVYNRWGQCVFSSGNPADGWNGTYKNVRQPAASYVWYCRYRFAGSAEQTEKGTVVIIR